MLRLVDGRRIGAQSQALGNRRERSIGIAVSVNAQPEDRHYQKVGTDESDFWLESYTAETLDSLEVFLISIRSGGVDNWSGYANPRSTG